MKRKIFVLLGVLGLTLGLRASGAEGRTAPVNPDFTAWREKMTAAQANAMTAASAGSGSTATGLRPAPFDARYLVDLKTKRALKTSTAAASRESLPTSYDLRTYGWVTSVKDQNPYGTCWAHGALASMESALLKSEGTTYDFSENNMVNLCGFTFTSMNSKGQPYPWDGENEGGHYLMSLAYLLRWSGPVSETDDPYCTPGNSVAHDAQRHLIGCQWITQRTSALDNDEIKQAVLDHGAVAIDYYHSSSYLKGSSYYCPYSYTGNHLVAVVGWDDNYSKSNFATKPSGNGAFLIKNSWGTSFGSSGYFWVSYYDKTLGYGNPMVSYYNVDPSGNYKNIYQYDELGFVGSLWTSEEGTGYGACVFTAKDSENISAVGFYALADTTSYKISVRTGVSATDPSSGTLATTVSGTAPHLGYVVVSLPSAVKVAKGANFAVTVKLTTDGYNYPLAYAAVSSDYSEKEVISGKCYLSEDGTSWEKTSEEDICLKAYSTAASTATLSSIAISGASNLTSGNASTYTCTATYSDSSTGTVSPTWTITSGSSYASISSSGVLTANTVSSTQSVTIKASYTSGGVTKMATKTVTINPATTTSHTLTIPAAGGDGTVSFTIATSGYYHFAGANPDSWITSLSGSIAGNWSYSFEESDSSFTLSANSTVTLNCSADANTTGSTRTWDYVITGPENHTITIQQPSQSSDPTAQVTVTFDANGGSVSETSRQVAKGSAIGTLPVPTWTDHVFAGWFTANNVQVTETTLVIANVTLYAHWTDASGSASYALIVGINKYTLSGCSTLSGCVPDSCAVKMLCTEYGDWEEDNVVVLNDSEATLVRYRQEIANLAAKAKSGDTVLIYDSGHGGTTYDTSGNPTKNACICTYDAEYSDTLFASDVAKFASGVKLVIMLDTCHSAGMFKNTAQATDAQASAESFLANFIANVSSEIDGIKTRSNKATAAATIGSSEIGWLAAADYDEYSSDYGVGLFTSVMCVDSGVLQGNADANGDGRVTFYELYRHAVDFKNEYSLDQTAQAANTTVLGSVSVENRNVDIATALDNAALDFDDGTLLGFNGIARWVGECDDGVYAARSVVIPDSYSATLGTTVSGVGTVSFRWKVSSESGYDKLQFYVDGALQKTISGEQDWAEVSFEISDDGEHVLKWKYQKDSSSSEGTDCGWVGEVRWSNPSTGDADLQFWDGYDNWPQGVFLSDSPANTNAVYAFEEGSEIYLFNAVCNAGEGSTVNGFNVKHEVLDDGGSVLADEDSYYSSALPGKDSLNTYGFYWGGNAFTCLQNLSAGTYTYRCTLDSEGDVVESDESNNVFEYTFTVEAAPVLVTVTFDPNGGECSETSRQVTSGSAIGTLPTAKRSGYSFLGWFTDSESGDAVSASTSVTEDVTFYAHWQDNSVAPNWKNEIVKKNLKMTVYARIKDVVAESLLEHSDGLLAAFAANGECRGCTSFQTDDNVNLFGLSVGIDSVSETGFTLKYWSSATGVLDVIDGFDANEDRQIGTFEAPVEYRVGALAVEVTIDEGWNWVSIPVKPDDLGVGSVLSGYTWSNGDIVEAADGASTYYNGKWRSGDFSEIVPGAGYCIRKSAGGIETVEIAGAAIESSVAVEVGWNWIGSHSVDSVSMSDVMHSAGFANGDVVNSADGMSTYYNGKWRSGDFSTLDPGAAYVAKFANAGVLTFGQSKSAAANVKAMAVKSSVKGSAPSWKSEIVTKPKSVQLYCRISKSDGSGYIETAGSMLGAFTADGECRGATTIIVDEDSAVFSIKVGAETETEDGFVLKVWDAATEEIYDVQGTFGFSDAVSGNIGLYWEPVEKVATIPLPTTTVITFSANGGVGGPSGAVTATKGKAMPTISGTPTKTGYTFGGYSDSAKGGVTYYNADLTSAKNWDKDDATATLYAQWTANTYTVTFHKNDDTAATKTQNFTYDAKQKLAANTFTWAGHDFVGWAETAEGDVLLGDGASVLNLTAKANGNVDLYAKWEKQKISIIINGESAQYEYGEEVTLTPPTETVGIHGYTNLVCQGWNGGTGSIPATGTGSEVSFTVTQSSTINWLYQTNYFFKVTTDGRGTVDYDKSGLVADNGGYWALLGKVIALTATADAHNDFTGWKNEESGSMVSTENPATFTVNKPLWLCACFEAETFTVKFELGDYGTWSGGGKEEQTVEYGGSAEAPTVTAKEGCIFKGWDSDGWKNVTGELTVKAVYDFTQYVISYEKVHGDNSANPTKYAVTNETIKFAAPKNIPTGYHFQGWSPASIAKGSTGDKTVTALWKFDFAVDGGKAEEVAPGASVTRTATGEGTWGETNVVCTGWIGTGDVPAKGEKNTVTFTINQPSTLTWLYVTNYMVRVNGGTLTDDTKKTYELNGDWVPMGTKLTAKTELNTTNNYVNLIYRGAYTGTGDVKSGTGGTVTFTVTKPSSVTWNYDTNYCFRVTKEGEGTLAFEKTEFEKEGYWPAGTSVKVTATADTSKHYHFAGWTDALTTGASLGTETEKTFVLNAPTLVKAVFALDTFTVTFVADDKGEITSGKATQSVGYGQSATAPTVTAKPGYTFMRWDKTFDKITSDLKVTAQYETLDYTITYEDTKGCDNAKNKTSFTVEDAFRFSALTNPPGWKFLGWEPSAIEKGTASNVTVTAQWEHLKYAIAIDGVAGEDLYYGDQKTASTFAEKTVGYTNLVCIGWTGTGDVTSGTGTQVTFTVTQESSLTWLYQTNYWFEAAAVGAGTVEVGADGFAADVAGCWVPFGTNLVVTAVPAEHNHFTGWKDAEDGTALADADEATFSFVMDAPALLEATFAIDTFTVVFDLGEFGVRTGGGELKQTVEYGKGAVAPELSVDAGHAFLRWDRDIDVITGNIVVKAIYDELRFDIIYNDTKDCDNSANPTHYMTTNDLVVFSALTNPPGWKFLGWEPKAIEKGTEGAVTVTAQWEHLKYELNVGGVTSDDHYYGDVITLAQTPQQVSGYTNLVCLGWTGSGDVPATGVGTQVTFMVTQKSAIGWLYETNYWFEAAVDGEGSIVVGADGFAADVAGCWVPFGTNLVVTAVSAEHHHFTGWKDLEDEAALADADEEMLSFAMDMPALLKATFVIDTFEVTFDVGDRGKRTGGGELTQTVEYGKAAVAPTLEVKKGYAFTGWSETFDVVTDDLVVRATYEREVPEIVDPEDIAQGGAPAVEKKAANYVGYLYDAGDGALAGTVQVTAGKGSTDRKTGAYTSKISVSIQLANETKKISISGKYDLTNMTAQTFSNNAKPPRSVTLLLGADGLTGTFEGYTIGGVLKATESADYQGSYSIFSDEGQFVVTINQKGTAKVAGTTTAGKTVSASVALLKGEDNVCVPIAVPKLGLAFTFWLTADEMFVEGLTNAEVGTAGTLAEGATFQIDSDELAELIGDKSFSAYFPSGLSVAQNEKGKWIVAPDENGKAGKTGSVVLNKDGSVNEKKLGENPSALKLTYTAKNGTFTGSFKAYYSYQSSARSAVKAKAVSFKVKGLLVNGVGYGTASAKIGKETVLIGLEIR